MTKSTTMMSIFIMTLSLFKTPSSGGLSRFSIPLKSSAYLLSPSMQSIANA